MCIHGNVLVRTSLLRCLCIQSFSLPGEWRERRGEQLTVMPVPRTLSGPVLQLKPDVCPMSASSNFTGLQLSITKCHSLQKTDLHVELWSHLSLLKNWQADQFTCITHTPTLRGVIMVKIVHTTIEFLQYTVSKNVHFLFLNNSVKNYTHTHTPI